MSSFVRVIAALILYKADKMMHYLICIGFHSQRLLDSKYALCIMNTHSDVNRRMLWRTYSLLVPLKEQQMISGYFSSFLGGFIYSLLFYAIDLISLW